MVTSARDLVRRSRRVTGAIVAQLAQALASLLLQVVAVRALGAEGLGVFGLLYGGLVLATALATGLVGDALTVLDRQAERLRAGLQLVGFTVAGLGGAVAAAVAGLTGLIPWPTSLVLGLAIAVFILEELLRRLLMASLRFWSVVVVDVTCLAVTAVWLLGTAQLGEIEMAHLWGGVLVAQGAGLLVALRLLPDTERHLARWRPFDAGAVLRFGSWRAAQQGVRPATLTLTRTVIVLATSTAAFGEIEAARVYTAPTMLVVGGVGGFLFAANAADKHRPLPELLRRTDVGAVGLCALVLAFGVVATAALPWAGRFVTGGEFPLDRLAVIGWVAYAAASAFVTPYGGLGAVSGMHIKMFGVRIVEAAVSVVLVCLVLYGFEASASWAPLLLAAGALASGLIVRQRILVPRVRGGPEASPDGPGELASAPGAEVP